MSKTKSTIQESGKLQRRHSSYAKVRTQKVGSPASQLVRQSQSLRARPFRASQCTVLQWPRYPTQQKRKEGSSGCWWRRLLATGGGGWRRPLLMAVAAGGGTAVAAGGAALAAGSVARRLLLQKRGPTSSLWRQVLAWLVVRPSQCCGKFQHF